MKKRTLFIIVLTIIIVTIIVLGLAKDFIIKILVQLGSLIWFVLILLFVSIVFVTVIVLKIAKNTRQEAKKIEIQKKASLQKAETLNQEILNYVHTMREEGRSDEIILNELRKTNFPNKDIDDVMEYLGE